MEKTSNDFLQFQKVFYNFKKLRASKATNGGQFCGHPVKHTVRYKPKAITNAPKKGTTNVSNAKSSTMLKTTVTSTMNDNIPVSNPYSALDEESEEEVENVYDESANLLQSKKNRWKFVYFDGCYWLAVFEESFVLLSIY
ncbi:hypothetical protein Tco_1265999 [Tanacetum coccineum]